MAGISWFQDGTYTRKQLRQLIGALIGGKAGTRPLGGHSGITSPVSLTVTSTTWTVGPHTWVLDLETDATMGPSPAAFPTSTSGSVTAASSSFDRWDLLSVTMDDASSTLPTIVYTTGSTAATLPATPAESVQLAKITVPKIGTGSPTITLIAPQAAATGGILGVSGVSAYPASPMNGQPVYDAALDALLIYDSGMSGWRQFGPTVGRQVTRITDLPAVVDATDTAVTSWPRGTTYNVGDLGYGSGVYTPGTGGLYRFSLSVFWPGMASATFSTRQFVKVNGAERTLQEGYDTRSYYGVTSARVVSSGGELVLSAGDQVQAFVRHSYGSSMSSVQPRTFSLYKVA